MKVTLIGIDLAKTIFQVCGVNQAGKPVFNRTIRRAGLLSFVSRYPDAVVAMEACGGSNYWGRELQKRGYEVKLIPPQHVKPFVKGNKTDRHDALAICEAAGRPELRCVMPRSVEQTDRLLAHRLREQAVGGRTRLVNQMRGLLREYGVVVPQGKGALERALPALLEDGEHGLTVMARRYLGMQWAEWQALDARIAELEEDIKAQVKQDESARRLTGIKGVGPLIASAAAAMVGNGRNYKNGRHYAANLGLVPREHSSGGRQRLGGITKRGNRYLRRLLVQGAWSVLRYADRSEDRLSRWARQVMARIGKHKAAVAVANKLARIIWSMLYHGAEYRPA